MFRLIALSSFAAVAALSSTSLAAITYNSQSRDVRSVAGVNGLGTPARPITNAIVSAPDFSPFNDQSETISGGPSPNPSATGRATQQSSLLATGVNFNGSVFAQDGNSTGGAGSAGAESNLAVNFTLDVATTYSFNYALLNEFIGNGLTNFTASLRDSSNNAIFNFSSTRGGAGAGPNSFTDAGNLGIGSYTLQLAIYAGNGGNGATTTRADYQTSFVIPSAPAAACLLIPGLATLRRRRTA